MIIEYPNEFSSREDLETWALENFETTLNTLPDARLFSEMMLAVVYVKVARRCASRWAPEQMAFEAYIQLNLEIDLRALAGRQQFRTVGESAVSILENHGAWSNGEAGAL